MKFMQISLAQLDKVGMAVGRIKAAAWSANIITIASLLMVGGCAIAGAGYEQLKPGRFTGSLVVVWLGEGDSSGDGRFLFVPDPRDPLTFKRADSASPGAVIRPGVMYTDGGSIPKIAQAFNGLSPWGYAPAYMVHDWLFVSRHCLVDGNTEPRFQKMRDVTFDDSANIIGEAIQALVFAKRVQEDDTSSSLITAAVGTAIARNLWDEKGSCQRSLVGKRDLDLAEQIITGSTQVRRGIDAMRDRPSNARVVNRIVF